MGKYLRKSKRKMNIPIRVAAVLLCLVLFSTCLVSGLFARYAIGAQSSDQARVAKFSIEGSCELSQPMEASLIPGGAEDATLIIQNNSEVSVEYTITVTNVTNNLPLSFRMEKAGASPAVQAGGSTLTDRQTPGGHTDQYTLHIEWPEPADDAAKIEDLERMGMVDYVMVTVTAAQID